MSTTEQPQPAAGQLWQIHPGFDDEYLAVSHMCLDSPGMVLATNFRTGIHQRYHIHWILSHATYIGEIAALGKLIEACDFVLDWLSSFSMPPTSTLREKQNAMTVISTALAHARPHLNAERTESERSANTTSKVPFGSGKHPPDCICCDCQPWPNARPQKDEAKP